MGSNVWANCIAVGLYLQVKALPHFINPGFSLCWSMAVLSILVQHQPI